MTNKTLVVLAAGMGSRFGGIKQTVTLGEHNRTLLDFTITDAIQSGFTHIVHVVRHEIYDDYMSLVAEKYLSELHTTFVYQEVPTDRAKPRGVAEALSLALPSIHSVCAVVNADDYYGTGAMLQMAHLLESCDQSHFGMIGYILEKTLSENGGVNRGICNVNTNGNLVDIVETKGITLDNDMLCDQNGCEVDRRSIVSMNFWGFHPYTLLELPQFVDEFKEKYAYDKSAELPLPPFVDYLVHKKKYTCTVLSSEDERIGMTYREDVRIVQEYLSQKGKL